MAFPRSRLGYYRSECCLRCLYKIETQADLEEARAREESAWEDGPLMVFATLAEAVAYLADDGLTPEEEAREFARLGWPGCGT